MIRRLADAGQWLRPCRHPEHDPPEMLCYPPGRYEHRCPSCGSTARFSVVRPVLACLLVLAIAACGGGSRQACRPQAAPGAGPGGGPSAHCEVRR